MVACLSRLEFASHSACSIPSFAMNLVGLLSGLPPLGCPALIQLDLAQSSSTPRLPAKHRLLILLNRHSLQSGLIPGSSLPLSQPHACLSWQRTPREKCQCLESGQKSGRCITYCADCLYFRFQQSPCLIGHLRDFRSF